MSRPTEWDVQAGPGRLNFRSALISFAIFPLTMKGNLQHSGEFERGRGTLIRAGGIGDDDTDLCKVVDEVSVAKGDGGLSGLNYQR